jgi:deferrochelatase/peroxidase EfeB
MVTLTELLDLNDADADAFLEGIQGNIVKGHGRDFTRHVFMRFGEDVAAVRRFLARFTAEHVTTAAAARRATLAWHETGGSGEPFGMVAVPATTSDPVGANDFDFATQDPAGARCPFHAHIRKTNPRGDAGLAFERTRRIVRRGITYGERPDLADGATAEPPSTGVGLLFQCFQANLDQFAIQQEGSDDNDFFPGGVGPDAVIGQNPTPVPQHWPSGGTVTFTIANFVKMLGGEYLYAPSMAFLHGLETTDGDQA